MEYVHEIINMKRATVTTDQSGVIGGSNPTHFNAANPITLFIIQLCLILAVTQVLSLLFAKLRQPKVIAEVIGGILLGPTVLGRIPNFSRRIFPVESLSYLNLVSTIGLILFLFIVGLEVDVSVVKRNARAAVTISAAGMILPFGFGAAIAVPIYNKFIDTDSVSFGHFLLFVGTAMSITAFPVLCRILTELKLLDTTVGIVVLSAGVGNDVVGWVLLALTVALVNASAGGSGSGVNAVYILLCAIGWTIICCWPLRKIFYYLAIKTGSIENGHPTPFMMTLTLFLVFASAFVTDIIGVHAIFGGFIAAFAIPHEGGFAIALVSKIEDIVTILFLPLYFTLSGLKTNLGLLDNGITWGYTILLCFVAFIGKFLGCAGAARLNRFGIRESMAVGTLMSCKGLVELIVLNVGLSAGILDSRVFSMFVFMAVILTVVTTPLTLLCYPAKYRESLAANRAGRKSVGVVPGPSSTNGVRFLTTKVLVVLNRMEHVPAIMTIIQLLQPKKPSSDSKSSVSSMAEKPQEAMDVDALRLIELTGRMSAVMASASSEDILRRDNVTQVFRTFGHLNQTSVVPFLAVVPQDSFVSSVLSHSSESEMVIIPWSLPTSGSTFDEGSTTEISTAAVTTNPFDALFGSGIAASSPLYSHFLRQVFAECTQDVALFVHRGVNHPDISETQGQHLLVVFFGGADDRLALSIASQMCRSSGVTATVVRIVKDQVSSDEPLTPSSSNGADAKDHEAAMIKNQMTIGRTANSLPILESSLDSTAADNLAWTHFSSPATTAPLTGNRMTFHTLHAAKPLSAVVQQAQQLASSSSATTSTSSSPNPNASNSNGNKSLIVITGRKRRFADRFPCHSEEVTSILASQGHTLPSTGAEMRKTLGDVTTAVVVAGPSVSFLVVQAGGGRGEVKAMEG